MIAWFSCNFNSFLSSYRFILYFDCRSFTGVDSVFPTGCKFPVRSWVCHDESAISGYPNILYKSFVYIIVCISLSMTYSIQLYVENLNFENFNRN